jgi:hypothetical protein
VDVIAPKRGRKQRLKNERQSYNVRDLKKLRSVIKMATDAENNIWAILESARTKETNSIVNKLQHHLKFIIHERKREEIVDQLSRSRQARPCSTTCKAKSCRGCDLNGLGDNSKGRD